MTYKKIAFTIVLNGMPFIERQAQILPRVFDEWHIIEGATSPVLDTSWCANIQNNFYSKNYLSVDGTTEFIDSIADNKTIFVHRKNKLWHGKIEMCNQIQPLMEQCILMQFDSDELWNVSVLDEVLEFAIKNEGFDGMLFKCNYFVGPNLIIKSDNMYGDYHYEWCRLWKIRNKSHWVSHEPPRVKDCNNFLTKSFTLSRGWKFNHFAYVLESQLKFKENFYKYHGAFKQWKKLQTEATYPCLLKNYLNWVTDNCIIDINSYEQ